MADRSVKYVFRGDFGNLTAGLSAAGKNVQELGTKMTALDKDGAKMRAGLTQIGGTAGRMGVVAGAGLAFVTKAAMDWETAWTGVLKTVDGSPAQLARLEEGLRNLATETGFAHSEVAAVAEAAGQLGISTGGIEDFTRTMLDMGVSTSMSSEEAATGLARLRNIMGTTEAEIGNTGSAMVELGNNFATTEGEILAMSLRLAGAGRQAGLTTPDVLGLAASMSSVGIEAEAGGTAMSLTMKRIGKEVETGGDKLGLFAQTAGMSTEEFARAWEQDAAGALTKFIAGLGDAEAMGMSTNAVLRELGVTGIREADALIRLSGNAEQLAEALGMSGEGFAENSALAEEAGKFYDTSAQQAKQAWAEIKDAAIDAGAALLPVVSTIAGSVGGLASAFSDLPGPLKTTTSGLMGITAILGGGLWFGSKVVNGIADTKEALQNLGVTAGSTNGKLKGLVAGAGGLAVLTAALVGAAEAVDRLNGSFEASTLDRDFEALAGGSVTSNMASLVDALETLQKAGSMPALADLSGELVTLFGALGNTNIDQAAEDIKALDEYLAGLVESGNAELASAQFDALVEGLAEARHTQPERVIDDVTGMLEQYGIALDNVATESDSTAAATDDLSTAQARAAKRVAEHEKAQEKAAKALAESRKAAREQASAWLTLGDSLDDAKASLSDWLKEMEEQTQALNQFTDNAEKAANRGLRQGLIDALAEAGPAGALRMKELANATDAEIKRANKAWRDGRQAVNRYVDTLGGVPDAKATDLELRDEAAKRKIRDIMQQLADIPREIRTNYYVTQMQRVVKPELMGPVGQQRAGGGLVTGPGGPRDDLVPAMLSNREFVMQAAAVEHYGLDTMFAMNAMRLASGGSPRQGVGVAVSTTRRDALDNGVGTAAVAHLWHGLVLTQREYARATRASERGLKAETTMRQRLLEREVDRQQELTDAARDHVRGLRDSIKDIRTSIADQFKSDLFGRETPEGPGYSTGRPDNWAEMTADQQRAWLETMGRIDAAHTPEPESILDVLRGDIKDARQARGLYADLEDALRADGNFSKRDRRALLYAQQNASLEELRAMAGDEDLAQQYARLYGRRDQVTAETGQYAAMQRYGDELAGARKELTQQLAVQKDLRTELKRMERRLAQIEKHTKDGPEKTGKSVGASVNGAAGAASRKGSRT